MITRMVIHRQTTQKQTINNTYTHSNTTTMQPEQNSIYKTTNNQYTNNTQHKTTHKHNTHKPQMQPNDNGHANTIETTIHHM